MLCWAILLFPFPSSAETLKDALTIAWTTNPELAAARARQQALEETPEQARSVGRLTVETSSDLGYDRLAYGRSSSASITANLPIWTGGRVPTAVHAAIGEVTAGAARLRDAEAAVLERVIGAYADLLYNQQAAEVARVGIERLDGQVAEARSRFVLGQATRTDVAQLEAQRASVAANLADAEGALAAARANYRAIVGEDAGNLVAEVAPSSLLPRTLADARTAAENANPLILAQRHIVTASAARVDQVRAERAPEISLAGGYGRGFQVADGDWRGFENAASAGLTLRMPLLTGGLVPSRVRQAEAVWRAERFQADAVAREALRGTEAAWSALAAAEARLRASLEGQAAAHLALKGVRAEYGFGLRSTIDILVADQSLRASQLDVARARADVLTNQAALLRATGQLRPNAFE